MVSSIVGGLRTPGSARNWLIFSIATMGAVLWMLGHQIVTYWHFDFDDSFISYRFAENLANGHGFYWNETDAAPTEGSTSFLWVVVLAVLRVATQANVWIIAKIACAICIAAVTVVLWMHGRPSLRPVLSLFAPVAILTYPLTIAHITSGMETTFFTLMVLALSLIARRAAESRRAALTFFIGMLTAFMVRPESVIFTGGLAIGILVRTSNKKALFKLSLLCSALPAAGFLIGKRMYFGFWVPNSFEIKASETLTTPQFDYVLEFVRPSLVASLLFIVAVDLLVVARANESAPQEVTELVKNRGSNLVLLLSLLVQIAYFSTIDPVAGVGSRFLFPMLPPFLVLVAEHLYAAAAVVTGRRFARAAALLPLVFILLWSLYLGKRNDARNDIYRYFGNRVANVAIGNMLKGVSSEPPIVLATGEAGAIPFLTNYHHIDILGLTDNTVARKGISSDYVYGQHPDLIILHGVWYGEVRDGRLDLQIPRHMLRSEEELRKEKGAKGSDTTAGVILTRDPRFADFELIRQVPVIDDTYLIFVNRKSAKYELLRSKASSALFEPEFEKFFSSISDEAWYAVKESFVARVR